MSSNKLDQAPPPESQRSYAGAIIALGIIALGVVWTYIFFGVSGVGYWAKAGASVVMILAIVWSWRWRQKRISRQLELLQRWAADEDASTPQRRRKPA